MKAVPKPHRWLSVAALVLLALTNPAWAQSEREQIAGVKNFGRVTDNYFRSGALTTEGIENLARLGVRTIVDLRDNAGSSESKDCARLGIQYRNFPMTGHDVPEDKDVNEILSIIQNAKAPVLVHCSAGKHRAGTLAALYRTRVQGWPKERAWAEQQAYGFGSPSGHQQLYNYVYGGATLASGKASKSAKKAKGKDAEVALTNEKTANDAPSATEAPAVPATNDDDKPAKSSKSSKKHKHDKADAEGSDKHKHKKKDKDKKDKDNASAVSI